MNICFSMLSSYQNHDYSVNDFCRVLTFNGHEWVISNKFDKNRAVADLILVDNIEFVFANAFANLHEHDGHVIVSYSAGTISFLWFDSTNIHESTVKADVIFGDKRLSQYIVEAAYADKKELLQAIAIMTI